MLKEGKCRIQNANCLSPLTFQAICVRKCFFLYLILHRVSLARSANIESTYEKNKKLIVLDLKQKETDIHNFFVRKIIWL